MKRIRLTLQYDGTDYAGWQVQDNATGIQNIVENVLHKITGETIRITGAGRTDKGVHALGQVAHFDTESRIPGDKWEYHMNPRLPDAIRVIASAEVDPGFHARFDAVSKHYRYTIYREAILPPMLRNYAAHSVNLSPDAMREAIPYFLGKHDYRAFMATGSPVSNTVRTLDRLTIREDGPWLYFEYEAESFLYHQVRILTGTLVAVGSGKMPVQQIPRALAEGKRDLAGPTMPPQGLTLVEVRYGQEEIG